MHKQHHGKSHEHVEPEAVSSSTEAVNREEKTAPVAGDTVTENVTGATADVAPDGGEPLPGQPEPVDLDALKAQGGAPPVGTAPGPDMLNIKDQEIAALNDKILRLRAEFDNFRKRSEREREEMTRFVGEHFLRELLPILDSFDRAVVSRQENHSAADVFEGFQLIHKQLHQTLCRLGVEKLDCIGKPFDPHFHDAMMQQEKEGVCENTILDVCQHGYMYKGKVLRHAQVVIAKGTAIYPSPSGPLPEQS